MDNARHTRRKHFFLPEKKISQIKKGSGKKIDIEIRYETEKDADSTLLAQNIVKVIRMVLVPLEKQIEKGKCQADICFRG